MEGRVFKYFYFPRTAGVVEFSCQLGSMYHFAHVEVDHGDILEYDEAGAPVTAWSKFNAPAEILQEAERQRVAEQAERNRALDEWRQQARSRARGAIKLPYQLK